MKRQPSSRQENLGRLVRCAYCHEEIRGLPVEKNGYLYHSYEHARLDAKQAPGTDNA